MHVDLIKGTINDCVNIFIDIDQYSIVTINEARLRYGMAPIVGGELEGIMTPTGFIPLDRLRQMHANNDSVAERLRR